MSSAARKGNEPISRLYKEELGPLFYQGYEFVVDVPVYSTFKRRMNKSRKNAQGETQDSKSREDIFLKEDNLKMKNVSSFLLLNKGGKVKFYFFFKDKYFSYSISLFTK